MARYRLMPVGVYDTQDGKRLIPSSGEPWDAYQAWLAAGNVPDPYVPPTPPPETLAQAKVRKLQQIKTTGLARMQTRFPALQTFDAVQLVREVILSVAPAARQPTADFQWLGDTYTPRRNAADQVIAATTIAQVDAVTPAWPAL